MKNVLIMADANREYFREGIALLKEHGIGVSFGNPLNIGEDELTAQAKGIGAVIAGSENWTERVLGSCLDLKAIVRCGTGCDGVELKAAQKLGIQVANTPGLNTYAVAEMALTFILVLQRKIGVYRERMGKGEWGPVPVRELRGKTVGLLGFGGIAKQLAALLAPFGCGLLAYDIFHDEDSAKRLGVTFTDKDTLFADADIISIHLPLLPATKHLICEETITLMKPGCLLINTSRGQIVRTEDLYKAIRNGKIAGAAMDVHEKEPVPKDYCMKELENVILSPHVASATEETTVSMINASVKEVIRYYEEGRVQHLVNG